MSRLRTHSVFVDLDKDEVLELLEPILRARGYLKGIPKAADLIVHEGLLELECHWEEGLPGRDGE